VLSIFQLWAKTVNLTKVLLPVTLINWEHIKSLSYIPLKQAWAYWSQLFCKSLTFSETSKAADTGMKHLNFTNMPKYTYKNVYNTFFHAFLAFGSIPKHFHPGEHLAWKKGVCRRRAAFDHKTTFSLKTRNRPMNLQFCQISETHVATSSLIN